MKYSGLSGSSAGAALLCPTRVVLPHAKTSGEAAFRGSAIHAFLCALALSPARRSVLLAEVPEEWRHTCAGVNLASVLDGLVVKGVECSYALDVKLQKTRYIGQNIDRKYNETLLRDGQPELGPYEIPLSIDVVATACGAPVELDYKSGQSIGDVEEHWQRRLCAVALMFLHETDSAISRVAYIEDSGSVRHDGCEFSAMDAAVFCDEMVETIDRVEAARVLLASGVMPTVYPSEDACKYCPAMVYCPYQTNMAKAMLGKLKAVEAGPNLEEISPEELGQVWLMAKDAKGRAEDLITALKVIANRHPLPLEEGYEVRPTQRSKNSFDQAAARGLLIKLGATEAQMKELYRDNSYIEFRRLKLVG